MNGHPSHSTWSPPTLPVWSPEKTSNKKRIRREVGIQNSFISIHRQILARLLQTKEGEEQKFLSRRPNFHSRKSAWYCLVTLAYCQSLWDHASPQQEYFIKIVHFPGSQQGKTCSRFLWPLDWTLRTASGKEKKARILALICNNHGSKERLKWKRIVELCFYLKYHNPGIPNIVKVDGTLVRVGVSCTAHVVVLVPVDTHATDVELLPDWVVVIIIVLVQTTLMAPLLQGWDLMTAHDPIVSWQRADKGHLIIFLRLVIRWQDNVTLSARLKNTVIILLQQMFSHQWYWWSCHSDRDGTD